MSRSSMARSINAPWFQSRTAGAGHFRVPDRDGAGSACARGRLRASERASARERERAGHGWLPYAYMHACMDKGSRSFLVGEWAQLVRGEW